LAEQQTPGMAWLFFGLSGRLGRWPFFLGSMLLAVIEALVLYRVILSDGTPSAEMWSLLFAATWAGTLWPMIALTAKRLHDINQPAYYAAAVFIPAISIVAFLALCFWPGTIGANRYASRTNVPEDHARLP